MVPVVNVAVSMYRGAFTEFPGVIGTGPTEFHRYIVTGGEL